MVSTVLAEGYSLLWQQLENPISDDQPSLRCFCVQMLQNIMSSTLVTSANTRPKNILFSCTGIKSGLGGKQNPCLHWAMRYHARIVLSGGFKGWKVSGMGAGRGLWGAASQSLTPISRTGQARGQLGQLQPLASGTSAEHQPPGGSGMTHCVGWEMESCSLSGAGTECQGL